MRELNTVLAEFQDTVKHPGKALERLVSGGKKAIGCIPYFYPEELVTACGMVPFGLWGAEMQVSKARAYYPPFICSMLQTILEQGMNGQLDALSAVIIPLSCDSMKNMRLNWGCGVPHIPFIDMPMAQNRRLAGGVEYTTVTFRKIQARLAEISGHNPDDEEIRAAIGKTNACRAALRRFSALAGQHPELVSPAQRCAVIKSRCFLPVEEHTARVTELNEILSAAPESQWDGLRVVTTGILADSTDLLQILADYRVAVADDQVTQESVWFRYDTPETGDPVEAMALRIGNIEGCSVLYDPGKRRAHMLVELAQEAKADGVLYLLTKFCDPEEYDYVPVKKALEAAGIPLLQIEVDQQMENYEQARSAVETFAEMLRA